MKIFSTINSTVKALCRANGLCKSRGIQAPNYPLYYFDKLGSKKTTLADWKNYMIKKCNNLKSCIFKHL